MKRFVLSLLAAVLTIPVVRAEVRPRGPFEDGRLPLVPYPAEVCLGERDFDLGKRLTVRICSGDEEDFFAASTLTDELIGVRTDVKESRSGIERSVTLTRPGLCRAADERLAQAGLAPDSDPEGYVLLADERGVIVSAATAAGVFYGVQTLRQLVYPSDGGYRIRAVAVRDVPAMRYRWQQDDWSRGPIPTLEYAKKQIRILSEYKINGYCIYAENLFRSELHPAINPYGGTIAPEQIAELVDYAKRYHVEIVPQQQTFGHLHYVLRQERSGRETRQSDSEPVRAGGLRFHRRLPERDRAGVLLRVHSHRLRRNFRAGTRQKQGAGRPLVACRRLHGPSAPGSCAAGFARQKVVVLGRDRRRTSR